MADLETLAKKIAKLQKKIRSRGLPHLDKLQAYPSYATSEAYKHYLKKSNKYNDRLKKYNSQWDALKQLNTVARSKSPVVAASLAVKTVRSKSKKSGNKYLHALDKKIKAMREKTVNYKRALKVTKRDLKTHRKSLSAKDIRMHEREIDKVQKRKLDHTVAILNNFLKQRESLRKPSKKGCLYGRTLSGCRKKACAYGTVSIPGTNYTRCLTRKETPSYGPNNHIRFDSDGNALPPGMRLLDQYGEKIKVMDI